MIFEHNSFVEKDKENMGHPFTMSKAERMQVFGGIKGEEPHDEIWAEAKLGWEIGTVARAEDVVEREDGTTYGFLSSEKFDKWRYGCAPGAQTNLADGGLQHASVYIKTTFRCSSMGFSTGSLLFTSRGECKSGFKI